ncbi:superoxide dismutase family protein [Kitasatospora viridis]|uniref:Cu-Zn family superoxide dismutase n=1 Tax=Kitasatospora viridis TaxID=281105 RepID=A0A561UKX5_9ACTN|nr:superoxide dismutase family protein [Kitasatospora viridis]TWG00013.1 Cu-Zn family superoxide dismutase [Kitasatospora viridis]
MRAPLLTGSAVAAALALVALGSPGAGAAEPVTVAGGAFAPAAAAPGPTALSFAPDLVPLGAGARVLAVAEGGRTRLTLSVRGLAPDHDYPAHVHTRSCGSAPADSGPHYQDRVDPVQPSTDPAYANDRNELHLLLHTDADGNGEATAEVAWTFRPGGANSLVLHAGPDAAGHAPTDRVGCVNAAF